MKAHRCATPLPYDHIAAYCLGELAGPDGNSFEDQVFACDACAAALTFCESLVHALRTFIPPALAPARLERLERSDVRLRVTDLQAGETATVRFETGVDLLILHLHLTTAPHPNEQIDLEAESEAGTPLDFLEHIPVDRARGRLTIACQRHYVSAGPHDIRFRVTARGPTGARPLGEFVVRHLLED